MLSHSYHRAVEWGECDPAGIIFFPNYARWIAEGTDRLFLAAGVNPNAQLSDGRLQGVPSVRLDLRFLKPALLRDRVEHEITVQRLGNSSIGLRHRILRQADCLMEAEEDRIWCTLSTSQPGVLVPKPFPADIRQLLTA